MRPSIHPPSVSAFHSLIRIACACSVALAAVTAFPSDAVSQQGMRGDWQLRYDVDRERVQLQFERVDGDGRHDGTTSFAVAPSQLEGLTRAQLDAPGTPVRFQFRRDAGTFVFEGRIDRGRGSGSYSFTPDPRFAQELGRRGYERPSPQDQLSFALHDVGYAMVDELKAQGYDRPTIDGLTRMGMHGARFDYIRGMAEAGYRLKNTDRLVTLRDHGVTPAYVRELASFGYSRLSADHLQTLRDHGVTAAFVRDLKELGYSGLDPDDLRMLRDHGVTGDFIRSFASLGYSRLSIDELVNARDHGVTPGFVSEFRKLGYNSLTLRQLVQLRDHGVTPSYARRAVEASGTLTVSELIRRRDEGQRY